MSLKDAEAYLFQDGQKPNFARYKLDVIKSLCNKYNIPVPQPRGTGKARKADYIQAVLQYKVNIVTSMVRTGIPRPDDTRMPKVKSMTGISVKIVPIRG